MAYVLELHERNVLPYLSDLRLSRQGRIVLAAILTRELRENGDALRNNPKLRLSPGSEFFRVDIVYRDPEWNQLHRIELIVSDAAATFGVLRVVYVEDFTQE